MSALPLRPFRGASLTLAVAISLCLSATAQAQSADATPTTLDSIQVSSSWLGTGLHDSVKSFAGARTVVDRQQIQATGATSIGDAMRRIPGVQITDNSGTAGSSVSLNIGVRGLTGRYSPRSTVLLDGVPLAVAPYGQPQLSFSPVSLSNIESIDVVRGGGAVRYGPQNVGGIINFTTRAIPTEPGLHGEASARYTAYDHGGGDSTQYNAFLGGTASNGLGAALLYSGQDGSGWRQGSTDRFNDLALKFAYALDDHQELRAKLSYYDVRSLTPGGLTRAQYEADPFQNTRPADFWKGHRSGIDLGYTNTLSENREFEVLSYYNESGRASSLVNDARTQITVKPRDYRVLGIEPRLTQRLQWGSTVHDVTVGYRFLRERGSHSSYTVVRRTGLAGATSRFENATDAHSLYIDDRIAVGKWRITPGVRQEWIDMDRQQSGGTTTFSSRNNKALPSINVSYLFNPQLTVFANYTTSFGPVQNIQLNSQSATNPLNPEVARTTELGARWQDGALRAEVTVFKMRFDNQILQVPGITPPTFRNIGATDHKGVESAVGYQFAEDSALAGLELYANYTWTKAIQQSGDNRGLDVPFYSRNTDSIGARHAVDAWTFNLSSTHQSGQFADAANTWDETPDARIGRVPGVRLVNAQATWDLPWQAGTQLSVGVNNLADKRWYTRNVDGNAGRMVGAPRTFYVQGRYRF